MTCKKYLLLVVVAILVIHSSGFLVSSIQTTMQRFSSSLKTTNWMRVLREVHKTANKLNNFRKNLKIDFSAGCGGISSPHVNDPDNIDDVTYMNEETSMSPVLWAHQVGRSAVQKAPDKALLGGLVLIASELLRRGVNSERYPLPPQIREFANTTSTELEIKLEMLSSLNWKADPFLKQEYENLQAQPLEVLDKFITTSILPSVDKDLTPFLLKSKVDTGKVKLITQSVKDLIKLSMVILQKNTAGQIQVVVPPQMAPSILDQTVSSIDKTASTLIEQVDLVGQGIEGGQFHIVCFP